MILLWVLIGDALAIWQVALPEQDLILSAWFGSALLIKRFKKHFEAAYFFERRECNRKTRIENSSPTHYSIVVYVVFEKEFSICGSVA